MCVCVCVAHICMYMCVYIQVRSLLHHILHINEQVHVQCSSRERYWPQCLTPTVRGSGGPVMLWVTLCWHSLGPLVPSEGRVTISKVVLSDHLYAIMKHY